MILALNAERKFVSQIQRQTKLGQFTLMQLNFRSTLFYRSWRRFIWASHSQVRKIKTNDPRTIFLGFMVDTTYQVEYALCKGQSPSRGNGLLLFNKLNCCPPQLSINTKNSIPLWQSGLGNVMKTKANQWQNRQLTVENHTIPLRKTLRVARHEFVSKAQDETAWL